MQDDTLIAFSDANAARAVLKRLDEHYGDTYQNVLPHLLSALSSAADPDRSLVYFERFAENYGRELFSELEKNRRTIEILATLFSNSRFLTEILLRHPESFSLLCSRQNLTERKGVDQIMGEAKAAFEAFSDFEEQRDALRRYLRIELLRIGTCDFLGLYDLRAVLSQLSHMAIGLVQASLSLAIHDTGISGDDLCVLALGKLGGNELNYSSDIDLIFISHENPQTLIPLAQKLIEIISLPTTEGFLYRIDLRLRPWGDEGPLISTLSSYLAYIEGYARLWEKQALLKVRPIAGNLGLGEEFRREIEPRIHRMPTEQVKESVFAMKQRTEEFLRQSGREWGEVKLGVGSIRDIEFVVQALQLTHAHIRTRNTLKAIPRLQQEGLIEPNEGRVLTEGYLFFRTIEHYLQMLDYRQTNTLPSDPTAIRLLARRLGFEGLQAGEQFINRYEEHREAIRGVFLKYIGMENSKPETLPEVSRHLVRMDASYTELYSPEDVKRHADLVAQLTEKNQVRVEVLSLNKNTWKVTVVAIDYPGELSLICGLLFIYGLNILDGNAFTYEPLEKDALSVPVSSSSPASWQTTRSHDPWENRRKLVDVFTVKAVYPEPDDLWERYAADLNDLVVKKEVGQADNARGELARRVGEAFQGVEGQESTLLPMEIEFDNHTSSRYTILRIDAQDTLGFLYELTNALALYPIYIARVYVRSVGQHVQDTLFVTDGKGAKIIEAERQQALRSAIVLIKHFTHLLPRSPNPQAALLHFRDFLFELFQRPNWSEEIASVEQPEVLNALVRLLGVSDFLWEDFLRMQYENLFPVVRNVKDLEQVHTRRQLEKELDAAMNSLQLGSVSYPDWVALINAFKDRELFRIDMRHILGLTGDFGNFSAELTCLVEVVLRAAMERCLNEMLAIHGSPRLENGDPCPLVLLALGKCGGIELGFASDIEIQFVYGGNGESDGKEVLSNGEFFERLVEQFSKTIHARQESAFILDFQLRPYGKNGSLAVSFDSFKRYYAPDGPAWAYERQALVKLRPIWGDVILGNAIIALRDQYVYTKEGFDITAMRAMRERQQRHLVFGGTFNAKYSPGGLVDIEYLVQALQIKYGAERPALRIPNIREAMKALHDEGILSEADYTRLRKAHTFFRWIIDSLRVVRGNAKDITIPPHQSAEFAFLAKRLLYGTDMQRLKEDLSRYAADVQEINARLLENG